MPDTPHIPRQHESGGDRAAAADDAPSAQAERTAPPDLAEVAEVMSTEARRFGTTVTEVAAGSNPEVAIPLLLLAVSDLLSAGARLGAIVDVVPPDRFEPDVGPDPDLDPLRAALGNLFDGIDEYREIDDPVVDGEAVSSSISGDLVLITGALAQGQRHHDAGQVLEALWWWQFSYLSNWGERGSAVLRTLQTILAHLRLDVDDEVVADAEFQALHP